jgi:hypothetical protein
MPHYYTITFSLFALFLSPSTCLLCAFLSLYFLEIEIERERDIQSITNHQAHNKEEERDNLGSQESNGFVFRSEQWQLRSLIQDLIDR